MPGPKKGNRGKADASAPRAASASSPSSPQPWKVRFSTRVLAEDLLEIGHAAYENARKAIQKKLSIDPHQYGDGLRPPLGGIHKLKSSHVRVAYHIEESAHEVWILMVADRSTIWDRHEDEILLRLEGIAELQGQQRRAQPSTAPGKRTKNRES